MRVAVVDIGSNTVRLLVAEVDERAVTDVRRERHYLRLGDDVHAFGRIRPEKLAETADVVRRFVQIARQAGAERIETIVTAPGRQAANGDELLQILASATGTPATQLSGDDEGRLAWNGAVGRLDEPGGVVGVVDLGGGSCELAVGSPGCGPTWVRSLDVGALRVTRSPLGNGRPAPARVLAARDALRRMFEPLDPPRQDETLAVGGTARAIARVIGSPYGAEALEGLAETLQRIPLDAIVSSHGITLARAETLLGGTLVLLELAHRLDTELRVVRGGVREGAALMLARPLPVAA